MHIYTQIGHFGRRALGVMVLPCILLSAPVAQAEDLAESQALCESTVNAFNDSFTTIKPLDPGGDFPVDSGLIVHTIHGPGKDPTELNMAKLNALPVEPDKSCGDFMTASPPVFLPWCGSNRNVKTEALSDASSWTYLRHDTLINASAQQPANEVACLEADNKKYGLIFNSAYMNIGSNLGCLYPLDGDTGNRELRGCGKSQNPGISPAILKAEAEGACPISEDATAYLTEFEDLLEFDNGNDASLAGSLTCSLPKSKFDVWVDVRQQIDLGYTTWPLNEFVLWNWDEYSTADLAEQNILIGIYYLTGCAGKVSDGVRAEAHEIAKLYEKWSGVTVPVVNLSNSEMRKKGTTPFSCN